MKREHFVTGRHTDIDNESLGSCRNEINHTKYSSNLDLCVMSCSLDPGKTVGEAVHVLKGDERGLLLLIPLRLVAKPIIKPVFKQSHFNNPSLLFFAVSGDLQHVVEDRTPGGEADGGNQVRAVTIVNVLNEEGGRITMSMLYMTINSQLPCRF